MRIDPCVSAHPVPCATRFSKNVLFWQIEVSFRGGMSNWMVSMINVFGRNGGFKAIRDELMQESLPFARMKALIHPLYEVRDFLSSEFLSWFVGIYEPIGEKVLSLSDEDLKNDYKNVSDVVNYTCELFRISSRNNAAEKSDMLRLDFALKGFLSPFLERRLTGLTEICNYIDEMINAMNQQGLAKDTEDRPWASPQFMLDWLEQRAILESIFTSNLHFEVFKRCNRLLFFLSVNQRIGDKEVGMIWAASQGKHESIQQIVLDLLIHNVQYLRTDVMLTVLNLVESLKPTDYTQMHCALVRVLAMNLSFRLQESVERQLAGCCLLWRLSQDDVRFSSPDLHQSVCQYLLDVIENLASPAIRNHFSLEAIKNVRAHR